MEFKDREEKKLQRKKSVLKRWTILLSIVAILSFIGLGAMITERLLKGTPGGGLEINTSKLEHKLAWLGAEIRDVDDTINQQLSLASTNGVLINDVEKDSPADKAGLERGDIILGFDGIPIKDSFQIQDEILKYKPGDSVKVVVDKANSGKRIVYLNLGVKPIDEKSTTDTNIKKVTGSSDTAAVPRLSTPWGISVAPLSEDSRREFNIPASEQGVIVMAVAKDSLAEMQGLQVGDVIGSINKVAIPNLQSFYLALKNKEGVLMDVYSSDDGKRFFATLPDEGDSPPQAVLVGITPADSAGGTVAIASDSIGLEGMVFSRFSSSPYFILYDIDKSEMAVIENPYASQVRGMGILVAQMLIQKDIDAVIVGGIGPQAFDAFYLAKVKVYGPVIASVREVIMNYQSGELSELKEANLGGYGYSSATTIPTGSSPWTEDSDNSEESGYKGQPQTIPPKGKTESETTLTAGGDPRVNRTDVCICTNCGTEVTHPANTSCSDMVCPICGARLMNPTPGSEESGPTDLQSQIPATEIPKQIRPIALLQKTANNLWAISSKPQDIPPLVGQPTVSSSNQLPYTSQVTTCVCPLDNTTVVHPVGIPCAALQCPICGGRMVSGTTLLMGGTQTTGIQTGASPMTKTGGKPDDVPPVQQVFYLIPVTSKPDSVPFLGQGQQVVYVPVAGGPTEGGPNTGGPTSGGPAIDGPSLGGGQSGSGAAQSGRSTECICPLDGTMVTHPIGIPCASLTCPICGSRLVNAQPGGTSGGAAASMFTTSSSTQVAQSEVIQVSTTSRRIAIPSIGRSLNSDMAPLFDKAPYFMMFGLGKYELIRNPYYRDARATGLEVAQYLVGEGTAIVICNNLSMTALRALKDLQVKVYSGFTGTIQQAIDIYADGRLKDSSTITGIVIEGSSEHEGGGGPPSSKDKRKEKDESSNVF